MKSLSLQPSFGCERDRTAIVGLLLTCLQLFQARCCFYCSQHKCAVAVDSHGRKPHNGEELLGVLAGRGHMSDLVGKRMHVWGPFSAAIAARSVLPGDQSMKATASTLLAGLVLCAGVSILNAQVTKTIQKSSKADAKSAAGHEEPPLPKNAVCVLMPTKGQDVQGTVMLTQMGNAVQVIGEVRGLTPGKHGFHIHQYGDLRSDDGTSAGGHYNPDNNPHAGPHDPQHHAGDLGNITADQDGKAMINMKMDGLRVHFVIGRSIVVHAKEDDLKSQPSGDAGARVAVGVIGVASKKLPAGSTTTSPTGTGARKTKS